VYIAESWSDCSAGVKTYQISERVQLLTHQTSLLPPPGDLAVHKIEEQAERDKAQREVQVCIVVRVVLNAVTQRGEDGHYATKTYSGN
jgi:hypothetical protein